MLPQYASCSFAAPPGLQQFARPQRVQTEAVAPLHPAQSQAWSAPAQIPLAYWESAGPLQGAASSEPPSSAATIPSRLGDCNYGTWGHPELCNRPCVHMQKSGECPSGQRCEHCHLPHAAPVAKMDKLQRRLIQQLSRDAVIVILLPQIRQRAATAGLLTHMLDLIHVLEEDANPPTMEVEAELAEIPQRHLRGLKRVLARMPLCALVRQFPFSDPRRLERLLESVRLQLQPTAPPPGLEDVVVIRL
mmetsp:Transcript_40475/g.94633  ORF Transcript_40475/g.94633 Transcript_40475/m.94633 type:complete len:247 (-) Transcript_40475:57-797(-)|eukprot:s93_g3.t1